MSDFELVKNTLRKYTEEYTARLGYLGADWEKEIYERSKENLGLSFRVYFERDYCVDVYIEPGTWTTLNYLDIVTEKALEKACEYIEDGYITTIVPESFEKTF